MRGENDAHGKVADMGRNRHFAGDLTQPQRLAAAVEGVEAVVHCAARVGDWGPVEEYRAVNVEGLRHLLEACRGQPLKRFVHLSSLGVYAARHHHGTDETEPLPQRHLDGYTQSKAEAEKLALHYRQHDGVPVVVLRPGFIYGPRDRIVLPQLIDNLQKRRVRYIGSGTAAMNTIYVGNLVEAIFLALENAAAVGQIYNLTDGAAVSKRQFIEALADGVGVARPPWLTVPMWLAKALAGWLEGRARRLNHPHAPILTQARLKFLGLNLDFSIDKAQRELGYRPAVSFEQGMAETVTWYRAEAVRKTERQGGTD